MKIFPLLAVAALAAGCAAERPRVVETPPPKPAPVAVCEPAPRTLKRGDYLHIPAHARHRVEWTDQDGPTIWIAVHYG